MLAEGIERLSDLQERLYASDRWSVLIVLQAMDAAGKDSVIKHVMTGLNPQGVEVHAFKQPSEEELNHDFLWRAGMRLPESGRIGIFNRSYYEEVLVVRVHPELLATQHLPDGVTGPKLWQHRFDDIRSFRAPSRPQRHADPQVLPQRLARGAAPALSRPHRRAGQELEVLHVGRQGARALGRLHGGVRRDDPRDQPAGSALVRGAGRQQVVHPAGGGRRHGRGAGPARPAVSQGRAARCSRNCSRPRRRCKPRSRNAATRSRE